MTLKIFYSRRFWKVARVDNVTGLPLNDIVIKEILGSWNFSQLSIPDKWLPYGMYKFSFTFRILASKIFELEREDFTYLEITKVGQ